MTIWLRVSKICSVFKSSMDGLYGRAIPGLRFQKQPGTTSSTRSKMLGNTAMTETHRFLSTKPYVSPTFSKNRGGLGFDNWQQSIRDHTSLSSGFHRDHRSYDSTLSTQLHSCGQRVTRVPYPYIQERTIFITESRIVRQCSLENEPMGHF